MMERISYRVSFIFSSVIEKCRDCGEVTETCAAAGHARTVWRAIDRLDVISTSRFVAFWSGQQLIANLNS
jgi:hypothetical protein